ncbi:hypothetical protein [Bradyrhizobium sp. CB2312]|uniref:hypothetical protein n=1 Tax=Bradyrhizobium sp. CB2312 TaxID=3039155 RepID=UPI0024B13C2B|nr:hypothetical protein [Bradyrhizobium sp. CB2312]WFU75005.1 hypothetical protein QA642_13705 [Bradyrhizobium sp. CB2312]
MTLPAIKHYRAFQIDPDGQVLGRINLVCGDDEQARREAAALVQIHRIELWRLDKRIAQFELPPATTHQAAAGH